MNPQTPDNEVARLRELLIRAIEIAEDFQSNGHDTACYYDVNKYRCRCGFIEASDALDKLKAEARLAPAPEEPCDCHRRERMVCDKCQKPEEPKTSAHPDKCIGNVTESANPTCSNITHKFSHCDCENPTPNAPEWRKLGPDEVIGMGDECYDWLLCGEYFLGRAVKEFTPYHPYFQFRTRRPLPKQEEMPLEGEIASIEWSCAHTARAIRYLRDEIQKLKEQPHFHHESYCRKCHEVATNNV